MANRILIKRSFTPGSIPSASALQFGELALNIADVKLFIKSGSEIVALNDTANFVSSSAQIVLLLSGSNIDVDTIQSNEYKIDTGNVPIVMTSSINTGIFGTTEYIYPFISTASYSGVTVEYMARKPMASRMGILMATWNEEDVVVSDMSTVDIGDTSDIDFSFLKVNDELRLRVTSNGHSSGSWSVQTLFKLFPNINA